MRCRWRAPSRQRFPSVCVLPGRKDRENNHAADPVPRGPSHAERLRAGGPALPRHGRCGAGGAHRRWPCRQADPCGRGRDRLRMRAARRGGCRTERAGRLHRRHSAPACRPSVLFPVEPLVHGGLGSAGGREACPVLWVARHAKEVLIREPVPCRLDQGAPILPGRAAPEALEGHEAGFARPFVVRCHTLTLRLWEKFSTVLAQETSPGVIHLDEVMRPRAGFLGKRRYTGDAGTLHHPERTREASCRR